MRRYSSLILFALAGLASAQTTWDRSQFASEQIERYRAHYDVPGISVAIATNGKIIFAKGFGFADVERKIPVQTTDYFRLASVSKPITSTMIFELVEQGKLNLDWPVRQVLPELPAHHIYRIRDLLCHQSGVRHYGNEPPLKNYPTSFSALDRFVKDPLLFTPGEKYSYSTHGFTILGAVIEKIVKKPYRTYAIERLRAWGIQGVACETGSNPNRTKIYDRSQDKNKPVGRDDLSWKYPGGGYEATVIGMCNLGSAIESGKILKRETLEQMWSIQKPKSGDSTMALGWSIANDGGHKAAVHGGSQLGANSSWRIQMDEHTVIMVLSNRDGHKPGDLALYLSRLARLAPNSPLPEMKLG